MAKIYIEDIKLTAIRNKIFASLSELEQINIFDAVVLSSGDYLPTQKMIEGEYMVYGGGGSTEKKHNDFNIEFETLGIGRVGARCGCVFKIKSKSWITDNALYASKIDQQFDLEFLIHFFSFKNFNQYANTAAQPVISLKRISEVTIPKVDLKLQKEIALVLNYIEQGLKIENDRFGVSEILNYISSSESLTAQLTHQLSLVKKLRQQLLQDAVQGKLVDNSEEADESAHELLKRIKAEKEQLVKEKKLKKEKELPPIKAEEIPFEIPEDWVWCRLGEIAYDTEGGKSPNCLHEPVRGNEWGVIKTTAVQEMYFLENENKVLPKGYIISEQHKVAEGDILITRAGPKNRVGIVCCVENLTKNLILSDKTIRIKHSKELLFSKYIATVLNSPLIKPLIELKMTGMADSQVNISQDNMKKFIIPLPPLSTQRLIVEKVEGMMQLCDGLEASISASMRENEQLLQQVLREALQG